MHNITVICCGTDLKPPLNDEMVLHDNGKKGENQTGCLLKSDFGRKEM